MNYMCKKDLFCESELYMKYGQSNNYECDCENNDY